jgi:hypothetical protein
MRKEKPSINGQQAVLRMWRLWLEYFRHLTHPVPEETAESREPDLEESREVTPFCVHSRVRRSLARAWRRIVGRKPRFTHIPGICPICGLLPAGDWVLEYVLTVWFAEGHRCEFLFRGRSPQECYRISDGVLTIFMNRSTLSYGMDSVSAVDFAARAVPSNPKVSPEVEEAERIIAGPDESE